MATTISVFVSYSHADALIVAPIVRLLRSNKSLVFQDVDNIRPGKKWREEIAAALTAADQVYVFWCDHSLASVEVQNEWEIAISQKKDVIPVLLDATPLPLPLADFQWIDFRDMVAERHGVAGPSFNDEKMDYAPKRNMALSVPLGIISRFALLLGLGGIVLGGIVTLLVWAVQLAQLPEFLDTSRFSGSTLILGAGGVALSFYILRKIWRRIRKRDQVTCITQHHSHDHIDVVHGEQYEDILRNLPWEYAQSMRLDLAGYSAMAATLEAEILRRFEKSNTSRNAH